MEVSFCNGCENMLYLYVNSETSKLYHACRSCGNTEKVDDTKSRHVYNNKQSDLDISEIINLNPYISHDVSLPEIKGNKNIKCKNELCDGEDTNIKYIKYDSVNMKFIYICTHCGSKWINKI